MESLAGRIILSLGYTLGMPFDFTLGGISEQQISRMLPQPGGIGWLE
jgi:hypothetical protein